VWDCSWNETTYRIIDIGLGDDSPRLHIPNGARGNYVTLSHCWGKANLLTTTTSSLRDRLAGISITEMPKTFQDAVRVTHLLGFQYLWIDSLCIIQDSKDDWDTESSRMQDVYEHAILNISADAASDSTAGLCSKDRLPFGLAVGGPRNGERVYVAAGWKRLDSSGISHMPGWAPNSRYVLDTRGWVLQERILSSRILHFSDYEMAWECDTNCRCECTVAPRGPSEIRSFRRMCVQSSPSRDGEIYNW
jgi:hypothetical protein